MNRTLIWVVVIVIVVLLGLMFVQGPKEGGAPAAMVKVGFMGPLSGDAASYGESIKRGVDLAKKDLKADNIELVVEDSKCEPKEAVNAITKLISVDKVEAIVGEVCSGATLAAAPIANQNKVVMVSAASTSPKITDAGEYVFRVIPSDALQGDFGAKLVYQRGFRRLAILYSNEEYGVGFTTVLTERFKAAGGEVVASEAVERGSVDVRTQLTKIKAAKPNALYLISNSPDSAVAALKQVKELGLSVAVIGSEGLKSGDIVQGAKAAVEGMVVTSVTSGTSDFVARHKEVYGSAPGPFAAQAYDAFKTIALAIERGARTGEEIKDELLKLEFDGATGHIRFDQNGEVGGNYDVFRVEKGEFVLVRE